ncbi:MAG: PIN domain-containing protein [Variibacter sp.]
MNAEVVLDTNILVYAVSTALHEAAKAEIAGRLLAAGNAGVSGQILQEFFVTLTRKGPTPLSIPDAIDWLETLDGLPCVAVDAPLVRLGADIALRYQISYWDGAVLAAAHRLNATTLYTEDLNHDQTYGSVRVVNPFRAN